MGEFALRPAYNVATSNHNFESTPLPMPTGCPAGVNIGEKNTEKSSCRSHISELILSQSGQCAERFDGGQGSQPKVPGRLKSESAVSTLGWESPALLPCPAPPPSGPVNPPCRLPLACRGGRASPRSSRTASVPSSWTLSTTRAAPAHEISSSRTSPRTAAWRPMEKVARSTFARRNRGHG